MRKVLSCDVESYDDEGLANKSKALKDSIICMGWGKLMAVGFCFILYFLVHANSKGHMSVVLQYMLLAITIPHVIEAIFLFMAAIDEKIIALDLALYLCILITTYNMVLGIMGAVFFIRAGHSALHYILAVIFGLKALSVYVVICHDILILYAYKNILQAGNSC